MNALRLVAALGTLVAASPALAEKRPLATGERIDLNRANAADLMRLPGIGKTRAKAILAARARRPFRRPEDLLSVKEIPKRWFHQQKDRLVVSEPDRSATPKPNSAPVVNRAPAQ